MAKTLSELLRYGVCGGVCTAINLLLFAALLRRGIHYLLANSAAYLIAVAINYILSKFYVFSATESGSGKESFGEFGRFLLVRLLSLGPDNALFYIMVDILRMNEYVSKILLSAVMIMAVFLVTKTFVFRKQEDLFAKEAKNSCKKPD